jgi:VWFA-related protein
VRLCVSFSFAFPAFGLILVLGEVLNGQTAKPQSSAEPTFKTQARAVIVDVVVTDRDGRPVQGLPGDSFRVEEDGHPQKISSFEEHAATAHSAPTNLPSLPPNVFINIPREKLPDSVTVLLFDSLNTPLQDQTFVRAGMFKYLKNPRLDRRMAIFALGAQLRFVQGFSDDPSLLAVALSNVTAGAGLETSPLRQTYGEKAANQQATAQLTLNGAPPVCAASPHGVNAACALKQFQAEQTASRTDVRVALTLEGFQELAHYLGGIPGRKNVVWFSTSFPLGVFANRDLQLSDPDAVQRDYGENVRRTAALLADADVAIYPLSAAGTTADPFYDPEHHAIGAGPGSDPDVRTEIRVDSVQRNAEHATMEEIAADTGGQAFYDTNGLSDALNRIADLGSYFYTMSYAPTNSAADGKFRKIRVTLTGGKYKLAYRRGYFALDEKAIRRHGSKSGDDPLQHLMGPGMPESTEIPLALRVQAEAIPAGAAPAGDNEKLDGLKCQCTRYVVSYVIAANKLHLEPSPDGSRHGRIEVAIVVYDQEGQTLNWSLRQLDLDMDAAHYPAVEENGVHFSLEIDAPKEGFYLRSGVYDWGSNLAGTLEVPINRIVRGPPATASK